MSDQNVALVEQALRHLNETGEPAWELYSPELTFRTRGELGGSETFHGRDGLQRGLALFREVWGQGITLELLETLGEGDVIVVVVRAHLRGTGSGVEVQAEESWATWFRDGLIVRIEQYGTKAEAVRAAGLDG